MGRKDIKTDGIPLIGRINQYHVGNPLRRNHSKNTVNEIAVWIEDGNTLAVFNILTDEIEK